MRLGTLAIKNMWRNRLRTTLTILGVAIAILVFVALRTVLTAWTAAADASAKDRIATRHKITFIMTLPVNYVEKIRNTPGVSKNRSSAKTSRKEAASPKRAEKPASMDFVLQSRRRKSTSFCRRTAGKGGGVVFGMFDMAVRVFGVACRPRDAARNLVRVLEPSCELSAGPEAGHQQDQGGT